MTIKGEYMDAVSNKQYYKLADILIRNLVDNFDFKSISDLGTFLCDVDDLGVSVKLNSDDCQKLGKNLLISSYYNHPDITNALALQIACLERDNDYQTIANMTETAVNLNSDVVLNNIAYANFKLNKLKKAFELQKKILKMNNSNDNIIFSYNLMLYDLFVNGYSSHHQIQGFLNALINDDLFDYESAIVLAIFFDDYEFVEKHLDYFNKTFLYEDNIKKIINNYLSLQIKPKINEIANILEPKTYYENNFYLTK